jgi:CHAT domain-containing protein
MQLIADTSGGSLPDDSADWVPTEVFVIRRMLFVALPMLLPLMLSGDSRIHESVRLLAQADRFAMLYNWPKAGPLYVKSESLFLEAGDRRNALAAKFGYMWATADTGVSPTVTTELGKYLQDPLVAAEPRLLLRGLIAKAVLDRNNNETSAREVWDRILNLAIRLGDASWEQRAKAEIGQILYIEGDVQSATQMIRGAILSQLWRLDLGAVVHYGGMVGNGAVESGRPETGLRFCDLALRMARFVKDLGFPYLAYQGKARALIALQRGAEARPLIEGALERARHEDNRFAMAQLLVVAGMASENPAESISSLGEAVQITEANGFHHVYAWSTFQLASLSRHTGDLDGAASREKKAIEIMRVLGDRYHLPAHLALLAAVEVEKGNYEAADKLYKEATGVIEALLVNVNTLQLKSSLIATLSEAYVGHFELAATRFRNSEKAYEIIENARARTIADTLRGETERVSDDDGVTVQARQDINRIQLTLLRETRDDERQRLFDQLFTTEQLLWRDRNPQAVWSTRAGARKSIPLREVQTSLRRDEVLLEYVLGDRQSYCLEVTPHDVKITVIPAGRKRIENYVEAYLGAVRERRDETVSSKELYALLLQPVRRRASVRHLIIVPDGTLHLLPFDALKSDDGRYVLESDVVTYSPSATVLHLLRTSPVDKGAKFKFLGVGGVAYSGAAIVGKEAGARPVSGGAAPDDFFNLSAAKLPDLPGSREELNGIAEMINAPVDMLVQGRATEAAFKSLGLSDYQIIHLAVHGVADETFPDRAALVLGSSPDLQEDGLLQAREIRDLRLKAELVTLSACDTGNGHLLGQEGVASLERSFILAGAKAVIASLWTTDDIYTGTLMKRLYKHLRAGQEKGEALRQAKLDLMKDFGDRARPLYWAGFTLVGDGASVIF